MKVTVRLFATLRQTAGWKEQVWTLPEGAAVNDLVAALDRDLPQLGLGTRTFYVAVNEEYAQRDTPLHDGDSVGIFPPVSGGCA